MKTQVDVGRVHEQNRRFHDEVEAQLYDQRMDIQHDAAATERMLDELERVLGEPLPGGDVLDAGTGTGHVAIKLACTRRFRRVFGADISAGMLKRARASAAARSCTVEFVESDMRRLPFEDGALDLVVGCAVLHHLPDPAAFLAEVRRVLKPGAPCVFIGDPATWGQRLVDLLKLPLVLLNRVYKKFTGKARVQWEHDQIDVHTFSTRDVRAITPGFEGLRLLPEGFAEPLLDSSLLTFLREFLGRVPGMLALVAGIRSACRWLDRRLFDHVVPKDLRVAMKFSARRPR